MTTQETGVKAFWDNKDFNKGVSEYNSKLKGANKETQKTTKDVNGKFGSIGKAIGKIGVGFSLGLS